MSIKSMNYTAVSGGTLTIGNEVNGRLQNKAVKIPASLNYLILALETRIGTIDNINFQISKEKNMSEERMVINYTTDPETFKNTKIIININDLYGSELLWYNNLIKEVNL